MGQTGWLHPESLLEWQAQALTTFLFLMMRDQLVSTVARGEHYPQKLKLNYIGSAVAGQNNTFIPHKGVLSPTENTLYVTYSNGGGPYDGTLGT